jgi:nitroimidazol reductase NimA-like FMN-containing flavoprotein (pyridoxamine 5'-phosphate oxidase superfamily)
MAVIDRGIWLEHVDATHCWELLRSVSVGRVGVTHDSAPEIYPVNYAVDGQTVVFRTDPGTKLRGLLRSPAVCFEVDGADPSTATGWSVLVKGRAEQIRAADELEAVARLPLRSWTLGDKAHWIRIMPAEVTGRRTWIRRPSPQPVPPAPPASQPPEPLIRPTGE